MEKFLRNKVMIVDDDETIIFPIEMSLQEKGIETISFTDGEQALKYLKDNKVSVILLDYHMEPNINGDKFIEKLREFDKETIIYLQTAYSEDLPAIDMLENYQIQGYIDKGKSDFERMQLIISALKHAQTLELVKEQEKQIDALQYKDEFFGSFVNLIIEEINNKAMSMSGSLLVMEQDEQYIPDDKKEEYNKFVANARQSIGELSELSESIDIGIEKMSVERFKKVITRLLKMDLIVGNSTLNFSIENECIILDCNPKIITYIAIEILRYLTKQNINAINILVKKEEQKVCLKICHEINNESLFEKISKLAVLDKNITIEKEYDQIIIKIGNIEEK